MDGTKHPRATPKILAYAANDVAIILSSSGNQLADIFGGALYING